ncbi:MAG: hypothetical protein ACHQ16_03545, partial [Candidatus Lutacidiplasmatales archaeon]
GNGVQEQGTSYSYDQGSNPACVCGNLASTGRWVSASTFLTTTTAHNGVGELIASTDSGGTTSYTYAAPCYAGSGPTSVTNALGQTTNFSASGTGGSGGSTYLWSSLPPGCASSNGPADQCTPTASGTYNVTVSVRDSRNDPASAFVQLSVTPVPPTGVTTGLSGSGGLTTLELLGIAAVAAILVAAAVVLVFRRRGSPPPEETPEPEVVEPSPPGPDDTHGTLP